MEFQPAYLIFALAAFAAVAFVMQIVRHGGFKAAIFGAGIKNTVGEVLAISSRMTKFTLRVHELDDAPDRAVGIELVAKTVGSYHMTPITLSNSEARKLLDLLEKAVN